MNKKLNYEEIYDLFKTNSSKVNKEISKKIETFKFNMDFFKYYANKDIKNLLHIFELKLSDDELFSSFKSDIDQYISCISQIILTIKLFLKIQDILTKMVINAKNQLSKLENILKNSNQNYLFLYVESLLKISKKSHKYYSSATTLNKISPIDDNPKNSSYPKFFSHKIGGFSNSEIKSSLYDKLITPRFKSKSKEKFENQEQKNTDLEIENNKDDSIFTLSDIVFDEEPLTSKNIEVKLIEPRIIMKKNTYSKVRNQQAENQLKNIREILNETDFIIKNNKKNSCKNLLEMINNIYKKGLINSEEKVKLKQLVIEKSKKIEYLYDNIYINSKNDKNKLESEVKKIINSFVNY